MISQKTLHFAVASDARYLSGAIGTLASIRLALPKATRMEVIFLHDGLTPAEQQRVLQAMARLREVVHIEFLLVAESFENFPDFFYDSKLTYARLVLPSRVRISRLIYIDVDILVLKDLSPLIALELPETGVGGVAEKTIAGDMPEQPPLPLDPNQPYLNAGLLVLDLELIRQHGTFARAIDLLKQHPECCQWHDQSAINYVLNGRAGLLDGSWNVQAKHIFYDPVEVMPQLAERAVNVHFIEKAKPWLATAPFAAEEMFRLLLDEVDPGWRAVPSVKTAMAGCKERRAWAMPMLFFLRGLLRTLQRRDGYWDFREAGLWWNYCKNLVKLRLRRPAMKSLLTNWRAHIRAGMLSD